MQEGRVMVVKEQSSLFKIYLEVQNLFQMLAEIIVKKLQHVVPCYL